MQRRSAPGGVDQTPLFLAGASGAIGQRLVPQLLAAGYRVTGTTRSPSKAAQLRALGADAVLVDVFDAEALAAAVLAARPRIVIHQLTDLPANPDPAHATDYAARNARIRTLGTANLVAAAVAAGVLRIVAQSIAWAYAPGGTPRTEQDAFDLAATGTRAVSVAGVSALESAVLRNPAISGVVLRYGALYGPGTGAASPKLSMPTVHVDAAAHAVVLALAPAAAGVYNVSEAGPLVSSARACRELGWDAGFRMR